MTIHVITMVPSVLPKSDLDLMASPQIQELRKALMKKGGTPVLPILMGDATMFSSPALEPLVGPFDTLITKHISVQAYEIAKMSDEYQKVAKDLKILTFGFSNNPMLVNWVYPALRGVFNLFSQKVDCESKSFVEAGGKVDYELYQANGNSGLENYKRRVSLHQNRPFYMINLSTKNNSPEGKAADNEYTKSWLKAAFSYDVNEVLGGAIVSLDKGPKFFGEVAVVKYPTRELFVDWMECDYHVEMAKARDISILDRFVQICLPIY